MISLNVKRLQPLTQTMVSLFVKKGVPLNNVKEPWYKKMKRLGFLSQDYKK